MPSTLAVPENFTSAETAALAPYFGNTDQPIFVLSNLPEAVKGALFARYSRSAKSIRRLFLDEFSDGIETGTDATTRAAPGRERAERLYRRVFDQYGDDSVAQLGGAHIACEGVSNILTKVLERGRLMAYLEQSTRYVPYTDRPGGHWKYVVPAELEDDGRESAPAGTPCAAAAATATTDRPSPRRRPPCRAAATPRTDTARIRGRRSQTPAAAGSTSCRNTR